MMIESFVSAAAVELKASFRRRIIHFIGMIGRALVLVF